MNHPLYKSCLLLLSGLAVASMSACSTLRREPDAATLQSIPNRIQKGVSTQDSVRNMLGEAKRKEVYPTGERWLYGSATNTESVQGAVGDQLLSTGIGMIPYAGSAINSMRSIARVGSKQKPGATIDFDQRGVVQNYAVQMQ